MGVYPIISKGDLEHMVGAMEYFARLFSLSITAHCREAHCCGSVREVESLYLIGIV